MRINKREFAVEKETTPGTAETLVSGDVAVRIRSGDTIEPDFESIDTQEVQGTSSKRPYLIGRRIQGFRVSYLMRGPGDLVTPPAIQDMLEASMLLGTALKKISIGTISSGPFQDGETITGGTSSAEGVVFRDTSDGASELKYYVTSGAFQDAETITGSTSGASATSSSDPADNGRVFRLTDSTFGGSDSKHHVTAGLYQDGFQWTARGALANLSMAFRNGHPCIVTQDYTGALASTGDAGLFGVTAYPEESVAAPRFLNASLKLGAYSPIDVVDFSLEFPINPEAREDANDSSADGVLYADYERDHPRIRFDPGMVTAATYDYFSNMFAGSTFAMEWQLGSTAGSIWTFYADEAQFAELGAGARRNIATVPLEVILCGVNNDEIFIWQH